MSTLSRPSVAAVDERSPVKHLGWTCSLHHNPICRKSICRVNAFWVPDPSVCYVAFSGSRYVVSGHSLHNRQVSVQARQLIIIKRTLRTSQHPNPISRKSICGVIARQRLCILSHSAATRSGPSLRSYVHGRAAKPCNEGASCIPIPNPFRRKSIRRVDACLRGPELEGCVGCISCGVGQQVRSPEIDTSSRGI